MALTFDPFSQLDRFAASVLDSARAPRLMPVDLFRDGEQYVLHADLPGEAEVPCLIFPHSTIARQGEGTRCLTCSIYLTAPEKIGLA